MNFLFNIFLFCLGLIVAYFFIQWRYKSEMNVRYKWMNKRLKKGKWKMILAMVVACYLAFALGDVVFAIMPNSFILKPFFYAIFVAPLFTLFLYKYFYEVLGGKRKWKL